MFQTLLDTLSAHENLLWVLGLGSIVLLVGTAALIPWLITVLPADFFARKSDSAADGRGRRSPGSLAVAVLRNLLGVVLLVAGFIMLFIPGQGLLTMLIGVALIDFPGKRALLLRMVRNPRVFDAANRIRRWAHKPEFISPEAGRGAGHRPMDAPAGDSVSRD